MKIFSADQIKAWDAYTIEHEPVASIDLMERAATVCAAWIIKTYPKAVFRIFCGKGNNGGDGLAIARLLLQQHLSVFVYIYETGATGSPDFQENLHRLHSVTHEIHFLQHEEAFPFIDPDDVVIDALFGIGLQRPLEGLAAQLVTYLNNRASNIISIDLPSGLYADKCSLGNAVINARHTLTFEGWKIAFLMEENAAYCGNIQLLPIGLHPNFLEKTDTRFQMLTGTFCKSSLRRRAPFSHKGNYGHALMIAGSKGKIGAAVLAGTACMRSGVGLLTMHLPACGSTVIHTILPEAMLSEDQQEDIFSTLPDDLLKFNAIGIGPGIGTASATSEALQELLKAYPRPVVLDADALNILAQTGMTEMHLPAGSILTPHPKEFERLCGKASNHFERMELALQKAKEWNVIIILKTKFTLIACPDGKAWFNPTGNPGMAKAGSGDVLTGILTGLLARGYEPVIAAQLGVYWHGYAGDLAAAAWHEEAMKAGDIIQSLPAAFQAIAT